ncbi:hypothetical protein MPS_3541 [Mycobacterium pseudoshottsii JCM 15466]|nr:hypothetical protein MPS_3541 [Mycobacterium pseudoshottsii JCM 15466]
MRSLAASLLEVVFMLLAAARRAASALANEVLEAPLITP